MKFSEISLGLSLTDSRPEPRSLGQSWSGPLRSLRQRQQGRLAR
jgi:hypothetical protein